MLEVVLPDVIVAGLNGIFMHYEVPLQQFGEDGFSFRIGPYFP